jgi:hypothetical protein
MTDETGVSLSKPLVMSMRISNGIISCLAAILFVLLVWTIINVDTAPISPFFNGIEYSDTQRLLLYNLASVCAVASCQVMAVIFILQRVWPPPNNHPTTATMSTQEEFIVRSSQQITAGKLLSAYLAWNALVTFCVPPLLCAKECTSDLPASIILWVLPSTATMALMVIFSVATADHTRSQEYEVTSDGLMPVNWLTLWGSRTMTGKVGHAIYILAILFQLIIAIMCGINWIMWRGAKLDIAIYSSETGYIGGFFVVLAVGLGVLGPSLVSFSVLVVGQLVLIMLTWNTLHQMQDLTLHVDGNLRTDEDNHSDTVHIPAALYSFVLALYVIGLCLEIVEWRLIRKETASTKIPDEKSKLVK